MEQNIRELLIEADSHLSWIIHRYELHNPPMTEEIKEWIAKVREVV